MRKYVLGVVLGAILAVGPALALRWTFGGSFRIEPTFKIAKVGTTDAVRSFAIVDPGDSRLNLKVAREDGNFLFIEVKAPYGTWHSTGAINTGNWGLRHAFVYVKTPLGSLKLGHTWSILDFVFANQHMNGDRAAIGYGNLFGARVWEVVYCKGPAKFAIVEPKAVSLIGGATRVELPKIEAAFSFGPANVSFSYNTYKEEATTDTITVSSIALAAFAGLPLGPAKVTVNAYYGQNLFVYAGQSGFHAPYVDTTGTVNNTTGIGGFAQVMAKAGKGLFTAGLGVDMAKEPVEDAWNNFDNTEKETASRMVVFANYKLSLAKKFVAIPEFAIFTDKVGTQDANKNTNTFVGVYFEYDF